MKIKIAIIACIIICLNIFIPSHSLTASSANKSESRDIITAINILDEYYTKFNLIDDMQADQRIYSTFNGETFGGDVYGKYYMKKKNKTKTVFYKDKAYKEITEIIITDESTVYMISPVTGYIDKMDLKEESGITEEQFNEMDITGNIKEFIGAHNLFLIGERKDGGRKIYIIKAIPKTSNNLYSKIIIEIDLHRGVMNKSELYINEKLVELTEVLETEEIEPNIWVQKKMRKVPNLKSGKLINYMEYSNIKINQGMKDDVFNPEKQLMK